MDPSAGGKSVGPRRVKAAARLTRRDFAAQFEAAYGRLWCIATAVLADRTLAEDVMQEAALVALGKLEQFEPGTNFAAWMGQIVRFTALNEVRRRARRATTATDGAVLDASHESPGAAARTPVSATGEILEDTGAFDDSLLTALKTLEETARACLLLRTVLGLSYREIADTLDVPEGTAMSHVHRTRRYLRRALEAADEQESLGSEASS